MRPIPSASCKASARRRARRQGDLREGMSAGRSSQSRRSATGGPGGHGGGRYHLCGRIESRHRRRGRGGGRPGAALSCPSPQETLLKALAATGKPVIFVNCSGSAIAMPWEAENLPAILQAWYPGENGGTAVADVLFGNYNPAGRLPVTFYRSTKDLPGFTDYSMANRTYRYFAGNPLFAFGHGLSYTHFTYGPVRVDSPNVARIGYHPPWRECAKLLAPWTGMKWSGVCAPFEFPLGTAEAQPGGISPRPYRPGPNRGGGYRFRRAAIAFLGYRNEAVRRRTGRLRGPGGRRVRRYPRLQQDQRSGWCAALGCASGGKPDRLTGVLLHIQQTPHPGEGTAWKGADVIICANYRRGKTKGSGSSGPSNSVWKCGAVGHASLPPAG